MQKIVSLILLLILTNCAYRPVINPETSKNPGNYYKDLHTCKDIYNEETISERHRHRYELNFDYMDKLADSGMVFSGLNPKTGLVEIIEIPNHDWFLGVQFHPEYQSTVENPHPVFVSFVKACKNKSKK